MRHAARLIVLVGLLLAAQAVSREHVAFAQRASTVVASVGSQEITLAEIDGLLGTKAAELEQQLYTLRRQKLDELVIAKLVADEASRRGVSVDELFELEVAGKVSSVSDAEVTAFIDANRARLSGNPDGMREQIRMYLFDKRLTERKNAFVQLLPAAASVKLWLAAPEPVRFVVDTKDAPTKGSSAALVTVVEFSDFHCPYCRQVQATLAAVLDRYTDRIRLVFKHFPIDRLHPNAREASEAAECARDQNQFWPFHDELFRVGPEESSSTSGLVTVATRLHLDVDQFKSCMTSRKHAADVEKTVAEGTELGVSGTPTFFINGRVVVGAQQIEAFSTVLDEELAASRAAARTKGGSR